MSTLLERLREQAKELSDDERCILGAELLEPVNGEEASEIEKAWDEEILRRVEGIKSGKVQMIPHEEVMADLQSKIRMPHNVIHHPEAERELEEAGRYFEERSIGLAAEFEVEAFVAKIIANPLRYSIRIADVRRANLKRFPYHLNYILDGDTIAIVAVSHHRQRPYYWRDRLDDRGWTARD